MELCHQWMVGLALRLCVGLSRVTIQLFYAVMKFLFFCDINQRIG